MAFLVPCSTRTKCMQLQVQVACHNVHDTHTHIHTYTYILIHTHRHRHIHTYTHTHTVTRTPAHAHTHTHRDVYIHKRTHAHTHIHNPFEEIHISSIPLRPGPTEPDGGAPTSPHVSYCTPTRPLPSCGTSASSWNGSAAGGWRQSPTPLGVCGEAGGVRAAAVATPPAAAIRTDRLAIKILINPFPGRSNGGISDSGSGEVLY